MFIQNLQYKLHKLNTAQIITLSFAGVIFVGGLILWLPFCTAAGQTTSFTDAMFTATTCVCVTGLVTVVTATQWTLIGKIIILVLIQIGGVGLISLGSIIFISLRKKISLRNRRIIQCTGCRGNRGCLLFVPIYSSVRSGKGNRLFCFYGSVSIL